MKPSKKRTLRQTGLPFGLKIIYEDGSIILVNKPAGLPSVPIKGSNVPSAASVLHHALKARGERAYVVHRIDRFTSGLLLFAKTATDKEKLVEQFLAHTPERNYLAVVRGRFQKRSGKLIHYFKRTGMYQKVVKNNERGAARAELSYVVDKDLKNASLLTVSLDTGLQNQIRVQFSAIGHPVIGDRKYHRREAAETKISRVALHAISLGFVHPGTGELMSFKCAPATDIEDLIASLKS